MEEVLISENISALTNWTCSPRFLTLLSTGSSNDFTFVSLQVLTNTLKGKEKKGKHLQPLMWPPVSCSSNVHPLHCHARACLLSLGCVL